MPRLDAYENYNVLINQALSFLPESRKLEGVLEAFIATQPEEDVHSGRGGLSTRAYFSQELMKLRDLNNSLDAALQNKLAINTIKLQFLATALFSLAFVPGFLGITVGAYGAAAANSLYRYRQLRKQFSTTARVALSLMRDTEVTAFLEESINTLSDEI